MSNTNGSILLIADPEDSEAALVHDALLQRPVSVAWIDTADFPERIGMIATPDRPHPGWLVVDDQLIDLGAVSAVYRRSPALFGLDNGMSGPERQFALMEAIQGFGGVLASLQCTWVNHPARVADASYKPWQIRVARECGLSVPATLVTNVGNAARRFLADLGDAGIYKPMSPGVVAEQGRIKVLNATIISQEIVDDLGVRKTAHTFQRFIDKSYDTRVTVIGDVLFGVAIDAGSHDSFIDWRADYDALEYRVIEIPARVRTGIIDYMTRFGLSFAALDFSVDKVGQWWFLEANPNGLWAWLEEQVDISVAEAIASHLIEEGAA